jgi:DNA-binding CsgD family transcriptional regulator
MTNAAPSPAQPAATSSSMSASGSPAAGAAPKHRLLGMKLTAKQQATFDLKEQGKTREEIAGIMGVSVNVVRKNLVVCYRKLGISPGKGHGSTAIEYRKPEVAAAAIEAAADPVAKTQREAIERVNAALLASGIPEKVSEAMVKRMRVKYAGAVTVKKQVTTQELVKSLEENLYLIDSYIDDKVVSEASLRDLAMAKAALIEKRQLLRGEPTQILSDLERKKLNELLPLAIAEAQRRGLTVEGEVTGKSFEPA